MDNHKHVTIETLDNCKSWLLEMDNHKHVTIEALDNCDKLLSVCVCVCVCVRALAKDCYEAVNIESANCKLRSPR